MTGAGERARREAVIAAARGMNASGINRGMAGNLSVRHGEGFLITPSAMPYDALAPDDVVHVGFDGTPAGRRPPSTEWRFHRDLYVARADVHAVVHTHGPHSAALSTHGRGIPPFHYGVARAGGHDVRCARYATFGTQQLSDHALEALAGRRACLLAHHGAIAVGATLDGALALAGEVETLAEMYLRALVLGEPPHLSHAEMDAVLARYAGYGRPAS